MGGQAVKITTDSNILVRILTRDDARQSAAAEAALAEAELVALTIPALCELVWVLSRGYRISSGEIGMAIRQLASAANVVLHRPAVEAGLAQLEAGGDFADGVVAHEGSWLGADRFLSFDRKAVKLLQAKGEAAQLLG
jgi:predicted nucleic-acid-binding protein